MKGILIKGVLLDNEVKDILIEEEKIKKISENISNDDKDIVVLDGAGKVAIPGLINMHTHAAMTLMRGVKEDVRLSAWLDEIWAIEPRLDEELIYWGTKLACLEMIKTGTTCFNDQYWMIETASKAVAEMGLRSFQPYVILDLFDENMAQHLKDECKRIYEASKKWSPLTQFAIAVHSPYSVSEEMIVWASKFARAHNLLVHIHISETVLENKESIDKHSLSPVAYLEKLGVLGPEVIAAHCVWLSSQDVKILAKHNVKVVHNINSNLKLASGYRFKYKELKDAGVTVCMGTDGCASSNNLDLREALKTAALVQKAWRKDPSAMPLKELMDMATINGAHALRLNTGVLAEGALADLCLIDVNNYAFTPTINFLGNFIYSANSSCVDTVICNGNILMQNRMVPGEQEILDQVNRLYKKLLK
jgi:5-methylthioadenosine/S-adenosylhomocysteine deaminase